MPAIIGAMHEPEVAPHWPDEGPLVVVAAQALAELAPGTAWEDQAVGALADALQSQVKAERAAACTNLVAFKSKASSFVSRLQTLAHDDPEPDVRKSAAYALSVLEAPAAGEPSRPSQKQAPRR